MERRAIRERTILHCDLNNYYASVEERHNPSLRVGPLAVCGRKEDRHGIVLAKNQPAKRAGVKTGEAIWEAMLKCPDLRIVQPRYDLYLYYSEQIRGLYQRYTDQVEPYGIDECWLDVSGSTKLFGDGEMIADKIRREVKRGFGLTISVGVSFNKIFAKLGSDLKKPDAVSVISSERYRQVAWPLPAGELLGVGPATRRGLAEVGIRTIGELAAAEPEFLQLRFGLNGLKLWRYANGLDQSEVAIYNTRPAVKSVGHGITCNADLLNEFEVWQVICELTESVSTRLRGYKLVASVVQIGVRDCLLGYREFQCSLEEPTQSSRAISRQAMNLFKRRYFWYVPVRAITVRVSQLLPDRQPRQLSLFINREERERVERLELAIEEVRRRYGPRALRRCVVLSGLKMTPRNIEETMILPGSSG